MKLSISKRSFQLLQQLALGDDESLSNMAQEVLYNCDDIEINDSIKVQFHDDDVQDIPAVLKIK